MWKKKTTHDASQPPPPSFLMFVNISPMLSAWLLLPLSWRSVFVIGWTLNQIPVKVWLWSIYIFFLNLWLPRNVHHYFPDFVTSNDQDIGVRTVYLWFPVSQQYKPIYPSVPSNHLWVSDNFRARFLWS